MSLGPEERKKRLERFDELFGQRVGERLTQEKSRAKTTLSEYFNQEMVLAEEYAKSKDELGAWVHLQIAIRIDNILRELD